MNAALPPHDFVFNSIGDADLCREGLKAACLVVERTMRPVINHPTQVLKTGRAANVARLRGLPNVVVPQMAAFLTTSSITSQAAGATLTATSNPISRITTRSFRSVSSTPLSSSKPTLQQKFLAQWISR